MPETSGQPQSTTSDGQTQTQQVQAPQEGSMLSAPEPKQETQEGTAPKQEQTTEAKPEAPKPPEKYELKMPENSPLDPNAIERVASYAKEKGLTNEQAQELLTREHEAVSQFAESQKAMISQKETQWAEELKADKEFGGSQLDEHGQLAYRAASKWFGEEFVDVLKSAKLNHYPPLFKGLVRLGKAMSDDQFVRGGSGPAPVKSMAEKFYGKQESQS